MDAGKSTLLGVLTHGELDNGRGVARQKLFRHKHEVESGRTSSVGNDILGFDSQGSTFNLLLYFSQVVRTTGSSIKYVRSRGGVCDKARGYVWTNRMATLDPIWGVVDPLKMVKTQTQ